MSNYYNRNAKALFDKYQSLDPDKLHANWLRHLPSRPGLALDVGSGSGRDALWLAQKGWDVMAVEPAKALMELGQQATAGHRVTWIDDCLPALNTLKEYQHKFALVLLSAVLMHLPHQQRVESMETLVGLLDQDGVMVVSLRHGPDAEGRGFYPVPADEIVQFAEQKGFLVEVSEIQDDAMQRDGVAWDTVIVKHRGV